jgi:hypothetical protein
MNAKNQFGILRKQVNATELGQVESQETKQTP